MIKASNPSSNVTNNVAVSSNTTFNTSSVNSNPRQEQSIPSPSSAINHSEQVYKSSANASPAPLKLDEMISMQKM